MLESMSGFVGMLHKCCRNDPDVQAANPVSKLLYDMPRAKAYVTGFVHFFCSDTGFVADRTPITRLTKVLECTA
jgi:hypothetical protein